MGYNKEIIFLKNNAYSSYLVNKLLEDLSTTGWIPTNSLIAKGNDFNWIQLALTAKGSSEFKAILEYKLRNKEFLGFTVKSKLYDKFVTINMTSDTIIFTLNFDRVEDELDQFNWFHEHLIINLNETLKLTMKIEWRTDYSNAIFKVFDKQYINNLTD